MQFWSFPLLVHFCPFLVLSKLTQNILNISGVYFTQKAIFLRVPYLTDPNRLITITAPLSNILRIEMLSGRSMPLLFISCSPTTCERVRKDLNLNFAKSGLRLFKHWRNHETNHNVTRKNARWREKCLTGFYLQVIKELDSKTANEMLVKSMPNPTPYYCDISWSNTQ